MDSSTLFSASPSSTVFHSDVGPSKSCRIRLVHTRRRNFLRLFVAGETTTASSDETAAAPLALDGPSTSASPQVYVPAEGVVPLNDSFTSDKAGLKSSEVTFTRVRESPLEREAWKLLRESVVTYQNRPVGTVAARDPTDAETLNYDQVFIRDFVPSGIAFLLRGEPDIVREFLLCTLRLQSWEKPVEFYSREQGLMPASFKVTEEVLDADFGDAAIGRVAPVDSGLWWIILLRAYVKATGDFSLRERADVQTGMRMILKLCLSDGFDLFPTLLVPDGSCMIDRRMGLHGHPLEIQALFFSALRSAKEMLIPDNETSRQILLRVNSRLTALSYHVREYYWLDISKLNEIYRFKTEEYSHRAVNKFNIYPHQIPGWLLEWIPDQGGYLIGNVQPAHMDFRFFTLGNLWSVASSLASPEQSAGILDLMHDRWNSHMPLKICFPALESEEWRIITGGDPKNTPWSYHNGGSWPTLIWQFTLACVKMGRSEMALQAVEVMEKRISRDLWPEYYDSRSGKLVGKQARLRQTWSVAGYLVAKQLLANPECAKFLCFEEDCFFQSSSPDLSDS